MPGARGSAVLDIFRIGSQLQAAAPLPDALAYEFAYDPATDSYDPTGNIVKGSVRTTGGLLQGLKTFVTTFGSTLTGSPSSLVGETLQELQQSNRPNEAQIVGRVPMGLFDDIFEGSDSLGDNFNAGLSGGGGFNWNNLLNTGVNLAGQFLGGGGRSQGVPQTMQSNMMGAVPMVIGAGGAVIRSGGALLAARLTSLGLTRSTAWTMLKKFGPASLVGLGLTSLEIAQVARSKGGSRRMNMCNGRALRRASRRLEGFHRFYKRTCGLPVRQRKSSKRCK